MSMAVENQHVFFFSADATLPTRVNRASIRQLPTSRYHLSKGFCKISVSRKSPVIEGLEKGKMLSSRAMGLEGAVAEPDSHVSLSNDPLAGTLTNSRVTNNPTLTNGCIRVTFREWRLSIVYSLAAPGSNMPVFALLESSNQSETPRKNIPTCRPKQPEQCLPIASWTTIAKAPIQHYSRP